MRILTISANYPPRIGGPASSVPVVCRRLTERGHDVFVLASGAKGYPRRDITSEGTVYRAYEIGPYFSTPAISSRIASLTLLTQYLIRKQKIDIVHVHDLTVSAVSAFFGKLFTRVPSIGKHTGDMVYEFMGIKSKGSPMDLESLWEANLLNKSLFKFEKRVLNKYTLIHAPSEYKKKFIECLGIEAEKIRVIPNGIEMPNLEHNSDGKAVLTAARLVPWKGLDILLDALALVKQEIPDVRLKIAGEGPERNNLEKQVAEIGLKKNVEFLGGVPHAEVYRLMACADAYALPSFYDPAPHAPLEALSVGTPVIASRVGGVPEVVNKENGVLVKPGEPEELASGLLKVLKHPNLRAKMGAAGIKTAKKYEWSTIVDKIEGVYGEMKK